MSISLQSHVFEAGFRPSPDFSHAPSTSPMNLQSLVLQHLDKIMRDSDISTPPPPSGQQVNLLKDMGDYFIRTASNWALLTSSLMVGEHIQGVTREVHKQALRNSGLSDLTGVTALDLELGKLRQIRDKTLQYAKDVQEIWKPEKLDKPEKQEKEARTSSQSSLPPFRSVRPSSFSESFDDSKSRGRRTLPSGPSKEQKAKVDHASDSDGSDEEDEELFQQVDMAALSNRGKGNHVCPKGARCTKGGVDRNGKLVSFERNSSFVQHCNKHRKPYRCTKPRCPNPPKKRKFARRDGLERHQNTVAHPSPSPEPAAGGMVKVESN